MKKGLAFLLLVALSTVVQATEVSWLTNYGDALKLARTTARPLLLVLSRDDQASASRVASHALLDAYVLCRIDANSDYGIRVAEAFRVSEFPHSVIIDKTTKKILYSKAGRATDDTWKTTLTKYQGNATFRASFVTQPQMTFRSPSRTYVRKYNFRQPAVCNT